MKHVCRICEKTFDNQHPKTKTCSQHCRSIWQAQQKASENYTAENIIIQDNDPEGWSMAATLAHTYSRPVEWISRSLEACQMAGVSPNYFVKRYLKKDKSILMDEAVNCISREMQLSVHRI